MGGRKLPVIKVFGYLFRMRLSARGLARRRLFILLDMAAALWSEVRVVSSVETTRPSRWEGGPRGAELPNMRCGGIISTAVVAPD